MAQLEISELDIPEDDLELMELYNSNKETSPPPPPLDTIPAPPPYPVNVLEMGIIGEDCWPEF